MKLKIFIALLILIVSLWLEYLVFNSVYQKELEDLQIVQNVCEIIVIKNTNEEVEE